MATRVISDLIGTLKTYFKVGTVRIVDNSAVLEAKNASGAAYVPIGASSAQLQGAGGLTTLAPHASASGLTITLPQTGGSTGQALVTDGAGATSWATMGTGANQVKKDTTSLVFGSSSPVTMFTPPANALIQRVTVIVDTAFDGTAPQVSIGISGTPAKYMGAGENDLKTTGSYEVSPEFLEDGTPDAIIATYVADSSAAGAARIVVEYANPD